MALKKCRECGEQVSTQAKACPKCGAPNPTTNQHVAALKAVFPVAFAVLGVYWCSRLPGNDTATFKNESVQTAVLRADDAISTQDSTDSSAWVSPPTSTGNPETDVDISLKWLMTCIKSEIYGKGYIYSNEVNTSSIIDNKCKSAFGNFVRKCTVYARRRLDSSGEPCSLIYGIEMTKTMSELGLK